MSVSRMKNLIILVLSICAACLLAVAVPNRLSQTHEQRRMLAELKTLYESYGLRIELDELPRSPTLYSVELSESGAQTAAQALLGQKAVQPDGGDRFDAVTNPHYHVICTSCGRVIDLEMKPLDSIDKLAEKCFDGCIDHHTALFYGTCRDCMKKNTK